MEKHKINYYHITDGNGRRVYRKEGQWLTAEMAEELRGKGYNVSLYKTKIAECI